MTKSSKQDDSSKASLSPLDISEFLSSKERIISYIESVAEENDWAFLSRAIGHAAKSIVMSRLSMELGIDRQTLYKDKIPKSIPLQSIINALMTEYVDAAEMDEIKQNIPLNQSMARGIQDTLAGRGHFLYSPDHDFQFDDEELDLLEAYHVKDLLNDCQESSHSKVDEYLDFSQILIDTISALSEKEFCAGWKCDIEFELWERIHSSPHEQERGHISITQAQCTHFKLLSQLSQGWIHYDLTGKKWISLNEWHSLFAAWKTRSL